MPTLAEAEDAYRSVLARRESRHFSSIDDGIVGFKARHNLAIVLADAGRPDRAEFEWRRILDEKPNYGPAWRGLGGIMIRQGKYVSAQVVIERLLTSAELRSAGLYMQAELLLDRGNWEPAVRSLRELLQVDPTDTAPLQLLCQVLFERSSAEDAAAALEELVQRCPDDAAAYHNLGTTYLRLGGAANAAEAYKQSLAKRPNAAFTWTQLGMSLEQTGERAQALAAYEDAQRYDPNNPVAVQAVARLQSTRMNGAAEAAASAT